MPVYGEPEPDFRRLGLGQRVRQQRKMRGWTLRDLASRIPLSVAGLSALENDKAVPDIEELVAVSEALGCRLDALLPRSRRSHFHLSRRESTQALPAFPLSALDRASGRTVTLAYNLLRPLATPFVGRHFDPLYAEIFPATDDEIRFVSHHHEEFFFVLGGEVECLLRTPDGLVRQNLTAGDCMYYWSYLPHCLRAAGSRPATAIRLLHSGYGATDAAGVEPAICFDDGSRRNLTEQVAMKIRGLRQVEGVSSAELAGELEISVRRMTDLEQGRKPIPIDVLLGVCRRFRKPLEYFLVSTVIERPFCIVHRAPDIVRLPQRQRRRLVDIGWSQTEFRALASGFELRGMHPYYVKLHHPRQNSMTLHEHHGQEFVYVLNGEVTLETLQDSLRTNVTLSVGDMCFIDSTVPHRFVGRGSSPFGESCARMIDVFWCPLGESYLFEDDDAETATSEKDEPQGEGQNRIGV